MNLIKAILIFVSFVFSQSFLTGRQSGFPREISHKNIMKTMSTSTSDVKTSNAVSSQSTGLKELCEISKEACDAVSPMLQAFYAKISAGETSTSKLKSDATFFSIADGIVQHMFIEYLFSGNKFAEIVGEEDETEVNITTKPFRVDDLVVPEEFNELIESTLAKIKSLSSKIDSTLYKSLTVFVDPIDGTREFATGMGEFVTVLIGYNDPQGQPVAGITYRPLTTPVTWAAGAKSEDCIMGYLDIPEVLKPKGLLITDAKVSPFISNLIDELGWERVPSLASGNRALMLLEGKAGAYIRDTGGFAKWDTSGPQAVIEAYGGTMSKLPGFLSKQALESYTHLKTDVNLDIDVLSERVLYSLHNARDKSDFVKGEDRIVTDAKVIKEYSCVCGLVALSEENMKNLEVIHAAMIKVKAEHPPTFN